MFYSSNLQFIYLFFYIMFTEVENYSCNVDASFPVFFSLFDGNISLLLDVSKAGV